jgi:hypothetical protein
VKPIAAGSIAVPYVDLRPYAKEKGLAVRDQGARGTCSVFAVTFLLEHAYAKSTMNFGDLSEEYLNYAANLVTRTPEDGDFFANLDAGFQALGTYPEDLVPYQATFDPAYAVPQVYVDIAKKWPRFAPDFVKAWDATTGATQAQLDKALAYLDQKVPVAAGLWWPVPGAWATQAVLGVDVMTTPPNKTKLADGHSVALVGYFKNPAFDGGGYFIFRNSWGPTWGDQGHGYMPFAYVLAYANDLLAYPP